MFGVICLKLFDEVMVLIDVYEYGNGMCLFMCDGEVVCYFGDNI